MDGNKKSGKGIMDGNKKKGIKVNNGWKQKEWEEVEEHMGLKAMEISSRGIQVFSEIGFWSETDVWVTFITVAHWKGLHQHVTQE